LGTNTVGVYTRLPCLGTRRILGIPSANSCLELTARLRALDALASGKLPPLLAAAANPLPRKSRPPLHPANP
jgi:hypothetical protein